MFAACLIPQQMGNLYNDPEYLGGFNLTDKGGETNPTTSSPTTENICTIESKWNLIFPKCWSVKMTKMFETRDLVIMFFSLKFG